MRTAMIVPIICALGLAVPSAARAQAPPSLTAGPADSGGASTPAAPQAATPAPAAGLDESRSLFDETWRQFQLGRFQRYQDLRSGVLFTDARYGKDDPGGNWLYHVAADNVGYRDQRYFGEYERTGKFHVTGLWDEIPQFYSVDTKTPYSRTGSTLLLDNATQQSIQNGQANRRNSTSTCRSRRNSI